MSGTYPNLLAGGLTDEGDFVPFELFAGESDIVTSQGTASTTALEQFRVVSRYTDGTLIPWDGTTVSGQGRPFGIAAQPIPAGSTGPIFVGGAFNHAALIWPSGVTTLPARKAAFDGTNILIGAILGVGTPITYA
ncbi:MAG TPA: head decoration protein [Tepidisphaeraceae bacterium]|nr:head decoration protein [Tepidisphaeraceae bacterium]